MPQPKTITVVVTPDLVALAEKIVTDLARLTEEIVNDIVKSGDPIAIALKTLTEHRTRIESGSPDELAALIASTPPARCTVIDGAIVPVRVQQVVSFGEEKPAAPKASRKVRTKEEIKAAVASERLKFDAAVRNGGDVSNPHQKNTPEGKAWAGWLREVDEKRAIAEQRKAISGGGK